jgi:hypothetical protein
MSKVNSQCLESLGHARDRSRNKVVGDGSSNTNHGQTSVLEFLQAHVLLFLSIHLIPLLGPVNGRRAITREGLAFLFTTVLDGFNGSAKEDELRPPLGISLHNGINRVRGCHVLRVKGTNDLGPEPTDSRQHGGAAIGKFGPAKVIHRSPLRQTDGVKLWR